MRRPAGVHDRPWPDPNDEADGGGRRSRPRLVRIRDGSPVWVERRSRFGGSEAGIAPGEQSSPLGPKFQEDGRWFRPGAYHASAEPCGAGPPGRPWQTALLTVVAGAAVLLLAGRRRCYLQSPR